MKKAIIFPGQGSQYVGMGKSLNESFDGARQVFSRIDAVCGIDLSSKCFQGPQDDLKDTGIQQLAILATSLAAFEAFKERNIAIDYFSGLSLGEYSCLYASGVLSLDDVAILVKERASAMQEAAKESPSTMFAVLGLDSNVLIDISKDGSFYIANINAPGQIVVSLRLNDKDRVKEALESKGAKVIELAVSGGFHSPFMEPASKHLKKVIDNLEFQDAKIPIVSNVTAKPHKNKDEIKDNLVKQLVSSVLWKDCVEFMVAEGVSLFFEVGPSKVLRGLMRKINSDIKVNNIEKKEDLDSLQAG